MPQRHNMFIYIYFWIENVHIYLFVLQICIKRKAKETPYNVVVKDICFRVKRCSQLCLNPNPANQCVTPWYAPKAQHFRHYCPNLQPWSFLAPRNMFLGSKDIHKHSRLKIICLSPQKIDSMPQYVHKYLWIRKSHQCICLNSQNLTQCHNMFTSTWNELQPDKNLYRGIAFLPRNKR